MWLEHQNILNPSPPGHGLEVDEIGVCRILAVVSVNEEHAAHPRVSPAAFFFLGVRGHCCARIPDLQLKPSRKHGLPFIGRAGQRGVAIFV